MIADFARLAWEVISRRDQREENAGGSGRVAKLSPWKRTTEAWWGQMGS
jgi:hypothetical protein